MSTMRAILHLDSSARTVGSASRALTNALVSRMKAHANASVTVHTRDVGQTQAPSYVNEQWIGASFTPMENRTAAQKEALKESDSLIAELQACDVIVIGASMYNFGVPATLKAYFDQVARAGVTFKYNEQGYPEGLLKNKKAFVIVTSGGVPMNSPMDHMTPHLKTFLGLIGVVDVTVIDASSQMKRANANESALDVINAIDLDAVFA